MKSQQPSRTADKFNLSDRPYRLRNSCDSCYNAKLRCSGERPACARCRKGKAVCTYSPTKRPGRPRKAAAKAHGEQESDAASSRNVAVTLGTTQASPVSWCPTPQETCSPGPDEPVLRIVDMQWSMESDSIGDDFALDWADDVLSAGVLDTHFWNNGCAGGASNTTSLGHQSGASLPSDSLLNGCWRDAYPAPDTGSDLSPAALCNSVNSDTFLHASSPSSPGDLTDQAALSSFPGPTVFSAWCNSLNHWVSNHCCSGPSGCEAALTKPSDASCLCQAALMALQLHRKPNRTGHPQGPLEASLRLQRLLRWTWDLCKDCPWCGGDDATKLLFAAIADDLARAYRNMLTADERQRCDQQPPLGAEHLAKGLGVDPAGNIGDGHVLSEQNLNATAPESRYCLTGPASLRLGYKPIMGMAKEAFLRRVIGTRLQEIGILVRELSLRAKHVDSSGPGAKFSQQPLEMLTLSILEHIDISKGML